MTRRHPTLVTGRLSRAAALAVLAALAVTATADANIPCGEVGSHPVVGSTADGQTSVTGNASQSCYAGGVSWAIPADHVSGQVAIADSRVEGLGLAVTQAPAHIDLLLDGVVVVPGVPSAKRAIKIATSVEASFTFHASDIMFTLTSPGRAVSGIHSSSAAAIRVTDSMIKMQMEHVSYVYAVFSETVSSCLMMNTSVSVHTKERMAFGISSPHVTFRRVGVFVESADGASGLDGYGWFDVIDSHINVSCYQDYSRAAILTIVTPINRGSRLVNCHLSASSTGGSAFGVFLYNERKEQHPLEIAGGSIQISSLQPAAVQIDSKLASVLSLGGGLVAAAPVVIEAVDGGEIRIDAANITSAAGPAVEVKKIFKGTLQIGVRAAASLASAASVPLKAQTFVAPCSVTFGAYPADEAALQSFTDRASEECNVTKLPDPRNSPPTSVQSASSAQSTSASSAGGDAARPRDSLRSASSGREASASSGGGDATQVSAPRAETADASARAAPLSPAVWAVPLAVVVLSAAVAAVGVFVWRSRRNPTDTPPAESATALPA